MNKYAEANKIEREHMIKLVNRMSVEELKKPLANSKWTISGILAHLAFWDKRAILLIEKWKREGLSPSPVDTDLINEANRELYMAIPPEQAAKMAISNAEALDKEIENLEAEFIKEVEINGKTLHLNRAEHRKIHLGQIERSL